MTLGVSGTEGYAAEADTLVKQYESLSFAYVHRYVLHLIPPPPCDVLDIGSGTGRDAAAFAALGYSVVAVEPVAEMRGHAMALHPAPNIEWLDDSLPDLTRLIGRRQRFALVMLTAVWMHLDEQQREAAMPKVAELLQPGAMAIITLRHGPVPPGRRMFPVSADETMELARKAGVRLVLNEHGEGAQRQPGVSWTRLAFEKPAAG